MGKFGSNFIALEKHPIVNLNEVNTVKRVDYSTTDYNIKFCYNNRECATWHFKKEMVRDKVFIFLTQKLAAFFSFGDIEGLDTLKKDDLWNDSIQQEQNEGTVEQ